MSTPINHHYVPECYLDPFSNKKNFYSLNIKYKHIRPATVGGVGYSPDYFKINKEENLVLNSIKDPYYIEREKFKKHENEYGNILTEITSKKLDPVQIEIDKIKFFL